MSNERLASIREARKGLTEFHKNVQTYFSGDEVLNELMIYRKYWTPEMRKTLVELGVFKINNLSDLTLLMPDLTNEQLKTWGLVNDKGDFILSERFVVPIKDIAGTVIALVGWHPKGGSRKYVTTPTLGFSRDTSFFNLDCYQYAWDEWDGAVFVVEGIFDAIALRSLGIPVIANMGLEMSVIKRNILKRFSKIVAIPDNDRSGRAVNPLTNLSSGKSKKFIWHIDNENVFVILPQGVKDVDDFVREFEAYDDLKSSLQSKYLRRLRED